MSRKTLLLGCLGALATTALAQQPAPLQGKWVGFMKGQGLGELNVELVVAESGGSWRFYPRGNSGLRNPCVGKEFPIVVKSQNATDLVFEIKGSQVMQGCIDQAATLKSTDGKTLEGALGDGRSVSLARP